MKNNEIDEQVMYLGKWVSKKYFRAFVYNEKGQKLANSYDEFKALVESGNWFEVKPDQLKPEVTKVRKPKDDANRQTVHN